MLPCDPSGDVRRLCCRGCRFGPFFLKFCSYFPYNAKLCVNGHEWAKRQAGQAGLGFIALDNALARIHRLTGAGRFS